MALRFSDIRPLLTHRQLADAYTVKRYGDRYKLVYHKHGLQISGAEARGVDDAGTANQPPDDHNGPGGCCIHPGGGDPSQDERSRSSLSRARAAVFEVAVCNPWEYFVTLTVDPEKFDRFNLDAWHRDFSQWLRNQRRLHGCALGYLLVPEKHPTSGAWHMHGLFLGLPLSRLRPFVQDEYLPYKILDKLQKGQAVYDWPGYRKKYGFCTVEPLRDRARAASYIAKYVTKDLAAAVLLSGAHLYYCSHGLRRAELVDRGSVHLPPEMEWDFENEHVGILWLDEWGGIEDVK